MKIETGKYRLVIARFFILSIEGFPTINQHFRACKWYRSSNDPHLLALLWSHNRST